MIVAFSFAILVLLIIGAVLLGMSLARAASKEERMSDEWLSRQWAPQLGRQWAPQAGRIITFPPSMSWAEIEDFREKWKAAHPPLPLYDQDEDAS